jgi:hyperosmotically inducible protein
MYRKLALVGLVAASLCAPIATFASDDADADRGNAKAFVKDSAITAKIKAQLAAKHLASVAKIHVDTDANGVVWLSGTAATKHEIAQAGDIAKSTEHVVTVKNNIKLESKKD